MAIPKEPDSHRLKKYEELYSLTKSALDLQRERFHGIEAKVSRYLAVQGIVLGASALGLDEFVRVARCPITCAARGFLCAYVVLWAVTFTAILSYLVALRFKGVAAPPIGDKLLEHFTQNRYVDVLFAMSKRYLEAARYTRRVNQKKARVALFGYRCTFAVVVLVPIVTFLYVLLSVRTKP